MFVVIAESSGLTVMFLIIVRVEDWVICWLREMKDWFCTLTLSYVNVFEVFGLLVTYNLTFESPRASISTSSRKLVTVFVAIRHTTRWQPIPSPKAIFSFCNATMFLVASECVRYCASAWAWLALCCEGACVLSLVGSFITVYFPPCQR